jgi:hypothetical protein
MMHRRWTRWLLLGQDVCDGSGALVGEVVDTYPLDGGEIEMVILRLEGAFGGRRMLSLDQLTFDGFGLQTEYAGWQVEDSPELSIDRHSADEPERAKGYWRFEEPTFLPTA